MDREILFRGKRLDNEEWVEGGYWQNDTVTKTTKHIIDHDGNPHAVTPTTVGQYTGLTDKNGVKIFEGDVLRGKDKRFFRVDYNADIAGYVAHAVDGGASTPCLNVGTMGYYEVNGNIHDNPNLVVDENG